MMLSGLKIKIFFLNDETRKAKETGMDYSIGDNDVREMIFYHIDAIYPFIEKDEDTGNTSYYTAISVAGDEYISPLPMDQVAELIDDHLYSSVFFLKS